MWVIIHMYMETIQGIFMDSYPYLKLAKMPCFSYSYVFFFNKSENKRVANVLPRGRGVGVGPKLCVHM
jgi:hypothetical protein